jgi:predicted anti-sigma-YlaC factor YlaD
VRTVQGECERARQWASIEVDGELSTFERVLLRAHTTTCSSCRRFRADIAGVTHALRAAPLEPFEGVIEIGRMRRRARLRFAPAVAAMAVAAVGLGSVLAAAQVQSDSIGSASRSELVSPIVSGPDTINLSTSRALEMLNALKQPRIAATSQRSVQGGSVLRER